MKRILLSIIALFFPWIAFLLMERPLAALGALALQLTFVGWLPASIWAFQSVRAAYPKPSVKKVVSVETPLKTENINQPAPENQVESQPTDTKPS